MLDGVCMLCNNKTTDCTCDAFMKYGKEIKFTSSFQKHDNGKVRLELLDYDFIEGIADILTFGAEKYEANNWKKAGSDEDRERLKGAMMRHASAYMKGEKVDPETGKSHLYHMGCCQMFLDYFDRIEEETDFNHIFEEMQQAMKATI